MAHAFISPFIHRTKIKHGRSFALLSGPLKIFEHCSLFFDVFGHVAGQIMFRVQAASRRQALGLKTVRRQGENSRFVLGLVRRGAPLP